MVYKATNKGWISTPVFPLIGLKTIPKITGPVTQVNRYFKPLLISDNGPSHPKTDEINFDSNFKDFFLPPNCTAILQPMAQNLL